MKQSGPPSELPLVLDPTGATPLQLALHDALRDAILHGRLGPGARLPATRDLARQVHVARGTVVLAYEQLAAEGYLRGARGAGTFVVETLPDTWFAPVGQASIARKRRPANLSQRGARLARSPFPAAMPGPPRPFLPYTPSVDAFPWARWGQLVARHARRTTADRLGDVDPRGYLPLREALAEHLSVSRGVECDAARVLVFSGVHQALDLVARLLLDAGNSVWMEDPGYFGARRVLEAAAVNLVPVAVDDAGLVVEKGIAAAPRARLAYVTPAHQAPLGATLSLNRRMRLLSWADDAGAWVFEDDYDSEFRYESRPLPALQGLDDRGVVLHAGTLSKAMFPGLRLAYLVVPDALVDPFAAAISAVHRFVPLLTQAAVTDFIVEGDLGRHLRRARALYAERGAALASSLASQLGGEVDVVGGASGLQLLAMLRPTVSDRLVCRRAREEGVEMLPLSKFALRPLRRGGLVLGFAAVDAARTRRAVPTLREILKADSVQGTSARMRHHQPRQ
jgi:GntR family transcriptional regulator/MocR family aminotransferase